MVVEFIKAYVKPGHMAAYLTAQEVINRETPDAPGYRGTVVAVVPRIPTSSI